MWDARRRDMAGLGEDLLDLRVVGEVDAPSREGMEKPGASEGTMSIGRLRLFPPPTAPVDDPSVLPPPPDSDPLASIGLDRERRAVSAPARSIVWTLLSGRGAGLRDLDSRPDLVLRAELETLCVVDSAGPGGMGMEGVRGEGRAASGGRGGVSAGTDRGEGGERERGIVSSAVRWGEEERERPGGDEGD